MTAPGQNPSRPERAPADEAPRGPSASPTEARSQAALGLVFGFGAVVFWIGGLVADGAGAWALLALALLSTWIFARHFPRAARRGALGTRRYWETVLRSRSRRG